METHDYDPTTALQDARLARVRVADRATAPRYYYPVLGVVVGILVASCALGTTYAIIGGVLAALASGVLINRYQNATGLWVTYPRSGRARGPWTVFGVALVALILAAAVVRWTDQSRWWALPLALVGLVTTIITGAVLEPRLREQIRGDDVPTVASR